VVDGQVGRVTGVDAERVDTEARDPALDEELGRVACEPGEGRVGVAEIRGRVVPVGIPAGVDEHGGSRLDRAVPLLELENRSGVDRHRRVAVDPVADVELDGGPDERRDLDRVDVIAGGGEVRGGVEVGAGVLRYLELT
jgi:hypothetical protein